ncbi:hypothetical protein ILUMI_21665 [Ignelater luminosus]|uniref:Elongation of very long chain fatty acids protein n=1 Tax=Ignelater luminosus TaxID=2038154 RepID=A0A8K0FXT3_IGNLU|nr:hypothetical protein ILUMI_21665 [Ignelater luminosus]
MYNSMLNIFSLESIPDSLQKYLGKPDARVKNWMFLNTPLNLIGIYLLYAAIVLHSRQIMKNRKPFSLKYLLIMYNGFQILFSAYICKEIFTSAYFSGYKLSCAKLDSTNNKLALRMARAFWFFYLSKVIDLTDTIFFVLRKKDSQLTFLHIYHHTSMIFNWYIGVLYVPGGQAFFSAGINSLVHVIMYTYYLLSAMGPKMQKYLWWKKYLTQIQLIQFIVVMIHMIIGYINGCRKPKWLICFTVIYLWTLVILFANFYFHAYKNNKLRTAHSKNRIDIKAGGDMKLE